MDILLSLRAYRRVVEAGSFTRAADLLGLSAGNVSKLVARLEDHLGTRLLQRSTRTMSLTEAGRIYYEHCVRILDELGYAEQEVHELLGQPRGNLRVSVPVTFGITWLGPRVPAFLRAYPEMSLDVVASDTFVDLCEQGFDLALRVCRRLNDSTMVAKPLGDVHRVVVATPAYYSQCGKPQQPADLAAHNCLVYSNSSPPGEWSFWVDRQIQTMRVHGRYKCNNSAMLRSALEQGSGIAQMPLLLVQNLVRTGGLEACLSEFVPPPVHMYAMLPQQGTVSPKARAFIDFIAAELVEDHFGVPSTEPFARSTP